MMISIHLLPMLCIVNQTLFRNRLLRSRLPNIILKPGKKHIPQRKIITKKAVKLLVLPPLHPIHTMKVREILTLPITTTIMRTTIMTTITLLVFAVFIRMYMVDGAIMTPISRISIGTILSRPIGE
jgi:hypothetical protein